MRNLRAIVVLRTAVVLALALWLPAIARAQTTFHVLTETDFRTALASAQNGDTVVLDAGVTLTTGDLPAVQHSITIDGAGHALSGNGQFRGLLVASFAPATASTQPVNVTIQNLTIQNTVAVGGAGGAGLVGGGGGAGLGGALFVGTQATVTVRNVGFVSNGAAGGAGGAGGSGPSGGGGGGLGGDGGFGDSSTGSGGGGVGRGAVGGDSDTVSGGPGILTGAAPGGSSAASAGSANGGGGAVGGTVGFTGAFPEGGAGGGAGGANASVAVGGGGGFGGGGGGAATGSAGGGGYGGGGGGGTGGTGGYGGGGGGASTANAGGFAAGAGSTGANAGGGGGAGLGGAVFVQNGGTLNIAGSITVNGNSASGGAGAIGGGNGSAFGGGFFLQGSGTINFTPAANETETIADVIADEAGSGGGGGGWSLSKSGAGTLTLAGANTFTGGVTVNDGTLAVASESNLGQGGTLALRNGSTLAITSSSVFSRAATIAGAPTLAIGGGESVTWVGQIANGDSPGALQVNGGGTLALTNGANSYSGGTFVKGGTTLVVNSDNVLGAASGGLTLGDAQTNGILRVGDGSVFTSARTVVFGAGGAGIDTVGSSSLTLSGVNGSGGLTKMGTGALTLNGANGFTGTTGVLQGIFNLNGSVGGSVIVAPGAVFNGAGTVGGNITVSGGTLTVPAPLGSGTSAIGTSIVGVASVPRAAAAVVPLSALLAQGDLIAVEGGTLAMALTSPAQAPLTVLGRGIISDATLNLQVLDATPTIQRVTTYSAITAAQGLSIVDTNVTSNIATLFPNLRPFFSLNRTTLLVGVLNTNLPVETAATTPNASAVGAAVDRTRPTASGDLGAVIGELVTLSDPALDNALQSIAGEVHGSQVQLVALDSEAFTDLVRGQVNARQHAADEDFVNPNPILRGQLPHWWADFEGQHETFSDVNGLHGAQGNVGAAAFGGDWSFAGRWIAGAGGGYSTGELKLDAFDSSSQVKAPRAFGYAGFSAGRWALSFGGSSAWTNYDTQRQIVFSTDLPLTEPIPGGVNRQATSAQSGVTADVWTEVSDSVKIRTWTYDAHVGWRHARYGLGAWQESGAQSLSLQAAAQADLSTQADIQVNATRHTGGIRPHGFFSYRRELGNGDTGSEVQFVDHPESSFLLEGLPLAQDTITGQAGVTIRSAVGLEYTLDYDFRHASGQTAQTLHFRVRFK